MHVFKGRQLGTIIHRLKEDCCPNKLKMSQANVFYFKPQL